MSRLTDEDFNDFYEECQRKCFLTPPKYVRHEVIRAELRPLLDAYFSRIDESQPLNEGQLIDFLDEIHPEIESLCLGGIDLSRLDGECRTEHVERIRGVRDLVYATALRLYPRFVDPELLDSSEDENTTEES